MKDCNHDKCFANYILTSNPPQYPWICRKCGENGIDRGESCCFNNEYESLQKKFKNK